MVHRTRRIAQLAAALALTTSATLAQAGDITVYTSLEEDEIKAYLEQAKIDLPDIDVHVLRLSTGDLGPRILAEANNPQHDVIWGWALTSMMDPRIDALLEPYQAKGEEQLAPAYRADDDKWFAATGYMAAFCVNTAVLENRDLPMPTSWQDLTNPVYADEILMPNPVSSGTGYLQITALLQEKGDEAGWAFLKTLDNNIAQYTKSGSRPCKAARTGEYAIGVSLAFSAMQSVEEGYPIKMVIPSDGAGYEMEASGLMASSHNKEDAKRFLDWTLSPAAASLYTRYKEIVSIPGTPQSKAAQEAGLPQDVFSVLYPVDFQHSTDTKDSTLAEWQRIIGR